MSHNRAPPHACRQEQSHHGSPRQATLPASRSRAQASSPASPALTAYRLPQKAMSHNRAPPHTCRRGRSHRGSPRQATLPASLSRAQVSSPASPALTPTGFPKRPWHATGQPPHTCRKGRSHRGSPRQAMLPASLSRAQAGSPASPALTAYRLPQKAMARNRVRLPAGAQLTSWSHRRRPSRRPRSHRRQSRRHRLRNRHRPSRWA